MALFHMNVTQIKRSKGQSAITAAAYRAGENCAVNTIQARQLPMEKLRPFEGHPFQVKDNAEMDRLVWRILTRGLLTPISVRPIEIS